VGAPLFAPDTDAAFAQSIGGMIWPRGYVGAAAFYSYNSTVDPSSQDFVESIWELNDKLIARNLLVCPTKCTCDQLTACGKPYLTPLPNIKPTTTQVAMLLDAKIISEILNPFRGKKPIPVPSLIKIKNPSGAILNITSFHFSVIIKTSAKNQSNQTRDVIVGTASHSNVNIVVPRYNSTWIPPILLSLDISQEFEFDAITGFIMDMEEKGSQNVSLIGTLQIHEQHGYITYRQNDTIPCCIQDPKSKGHDCP
jgi:hypothetical protein